MKRTIITTGLTALIALTGAFGLAACSSGDDAASGGETAATTTQDIDVAEDLQNARVAVADALAEDDSWNQIMLASDVKAPTVKYGLLVVPYSFSEAASRVQGTITITDGKYTIDADSAESGKTWQIDQDGTITEVTE